MQCQFCNLLNCNCHNLITKTTANNGRFCNQVIRNIATSFISQKIDLYVEYANYEKITRLGIPLFVGKKVYPYKILLTDDNYMEVLKNTPFVNIDLNHGYFQTREISQIIYNYLQYNTDVKSSIVNNNPYNVRYNKNNDCFIHVRLGDIIEHGYNLGLKYYLKALSEIGDFNKLYVASDSPDHETVQAILDTYPGISEKVLLDEVETIQFGSTCRYVILSHGSFSAVIGWLSFYSDIYYPAYEGKMWHGDMYSVNPEWHKITDYR